MVDLIPKEARKTGEGKGSVLVKKGCEIVRWFVSSYSCFFLSFTTSLTVPSQLLFFFLLKLFVQSFLWKAYTYVTRILRFRCLSEARYPHTPLYSHYVRNSHLSHCLRLAFVLQSTRRASKNDLGWRRTKVRARTNQTQLSNGNKDHRMRPWHQWYNAIPRSNIILLCFVLVLFLLLWSHLRSSASFYTSSGSLFLAAVIVSSQLLSFFWLTLFVQALWPFWLLGASFDMLGYQPYAILPHFLLLVLFQLLRSNLLFCSSPTFSFILLLLLTIVPSLFFSPL